MVNNFKYSENDAVKCTNITADNHEGLILHEIYCVLGATIYDQNVVYAIIDKDGKLHHSIDRFELVQKKDKCITMQEIEPKFDIVDKPKHYNSFRVEVIDIIEDATRNIKGIEAVCLANVIKYVLRYQFKNGVQDLKKARFYLDKMIKTMEVK